MERAADRRRPRCSWRHGARAWAYRARRAGASLDAVAAARSGDWERSSRYRLGPWSAAVEMARERPVTRLRARHVRGGIRSPTAYAPKSARAAATSIPSSPAPTARRTRSRSRRSAEGGIAGVAAIAAAVVRLARRARTGRAPRRPVVRRSGAPASRFSSPGVVASLTWFPLAAAGHGDPAAARRRAGLASRRRANRPRRPNERRSLGSRPPIALVALLRPEIDALPGRARGPPRDRRAATRPDAGEAMEQARPVLDRAAALGRPRRAASARRSAAAPARRLRAARGRARARGARLLPGRARDGRARGDRPEPRPRARASPGDVPRRRRRSCARCGSARRSRLAARSALEAAAGGRRAPRDELRAGLLTAPPPLPDSSR